jgi:hypothetical protein
MSSRFPRIPHLPGSHTDVNDLLLNDREAGSLLQGTVLVTEKLDGLNVMIRRGPGHTLRTSLKAEWRPAWRVVGPALSIFVQQRHTALWALTRQGAVFGEWLLHTVSVPYRTLPDVFVVLAIEEPAGRLLPPGRMAARCAEVGLWTPPPLFEGVLVGGVLGVRRLVGRSAWGPRRMEGVMVQPTSQKLWRLPAKWVEHGYAHPRPGVLPGNRNVVVDSAPW